LTLTFTYQAPAPLDYPWSTVTATLPKSQGNVVLIDGSTGHPIPIFDERRLYRVTYLPAGYQFSGYQYDYDSVTGWQRIYRKPNTTVAISQIPAELDQDPAAELGPGKWVTVHGRRMVLSGRPRGWQVTWLAGGYRFAITEFYMSAAILPDADVLGIASGMAP